MAETASRKVLAAIARDFNARSHNWVATVVGESIVINTGLSGASLAAAVEYLSSILNLNGQVDQMTGAATFSFAEMSNG